MCQSDAWGAELTFNQNISLILCQSRLESLITENKYDVQKSVIVHFLGLAEDLVESWKQGKLKANFVACISRRTKKKITSRTFANWAVMNDLATSTAISLFRLHTGQKKLIILLQNMKFTVPVALILLLQLIAALAIITIPVN